MGDRKWTSEPSHPVVDFAVSSLSLREALAVNRSQEPCLPDTSRGSKNSNKGAFGAPRIHTSPWIIAVARSSPGKICR